MTTPWTVAELEKNIQNPKAFRYGYPTGYNDILVIDIDLKVLPMELRAAFFTEFIAFVRDNVDGFDTYAAKGIARLVIYNSIVSAYRTG